MWAFYEMERLCQRRYPFFYWIGNLSRKSNRFLQDVEKVNGVLYAYSLIIKNNGLVYIEI